MNGRAMTKPLISLAAALAVFVTAACSNPAPPAQPIQGTDIKGASIGGDFALVDKDGKPVKWADFQGKYRIVYFGYTFCPDACPTDVGVLMAGFAKFEKATYFELNDPIARQAPDVNFGEISQRPGSSTGSPQIAPQQVDNPVQAPQPQAQPQQQPAERPPFSN